MYEACKDDATVLIRVTIQLWVLWADALKLAGFSVELYPLVMVKRTADTKYNRCVGRHGGTYFYVIAHKGNYYWHSDKDEMLKHLPGNPYHPSAGIAAEVPLQHNSLRLRGPNNKTLRTAENSSAEHTFLIQQYCPPGGIVADGCCGTMPGAMSCLVLGRTGIFCDIDEKTAIAGHQRAKAYFKWLKTTGTLFVFFQCFAQYVMSWHTKRNFSFVTTNS
jgi:hypothetical protein